MLYGCQGNGTRVIDAVGWHGVRRPQDLKEVVRPEIVADEAEDGDPDLCFDPVLLYQGLSLVRLSGSE